MPAACGEDENTNLGSGGTAGTAGSAGSAGSSGSGGSAGSSGSGGSLADAGDAGDRDVGSNHATIRFKAKVGSADFSCNKAYPGIGADKITAEPQDFRFYVQGIGFLTNSNTYVGMAFDDRPPFQARDIALIDFENGTGGCSRGNAQLNTTITGTIPHGLSTIVLQVGVPEDLNHENPTTVPAPLQAPGMSWGWLMGFRFLRAEMKAISVDDGGILDAALGSDAADAADAGSTPNVLLMHLGSSECTRNSEAGVDGAISGSEFNCRRPNRNYITLGPFDPETDSIVVDLGAIMADAKSNLATGCHPGDSADCGNFFSALGVDVATGLPALNHTAFRIERASE